MPVIEGVGDEVTVVVGFLTVVFIGLVTYAYRTLNLYDPSSVFFLLWEQYGHRVSETNIFTTVYANFFPTPQVSVSNQVRVLNGSTENSQTSNTLNPPTEAQTESSETSANVDNISGTVISDSGSGDTVAESIDPDSTRATLNNTEETDNNPAQESSQPSDPAVQSVNETSESSSNVIQVRLKYLNDAEQTVSTRITETVGAFKRAHFAADLNDNMTVRLIFNGQLLNDRMTLQSYRIEDRTVLHVLVSRTQPQVQHTTTHTDLDISGLMWPLFSIMLVLCWIMYIRYPEFFSVTSIILLVAFSASFLVVYVHSQVQVP